MFYTEDKKVIINNNNLKDLDLIIENLEHVKKYMEQTIKKDSFIEIKIDPFMSMSNPFKENFNLLQMPNHLIDLSDK